MEDRIYLLVRVTLKTSHINIHEAFQEIQETATCMITDTAKVKIKTVEFVNYKLKSKP
jgi:hypothetical protein